MVAAQAHRVEANYPDHTFPCPWHSHGRISDVVGAVPSGNRPRAVFTFLRPIERVLVASRAIWFYLSKLIWPSSLTFIYPRWDIAPTHLLNYAHGYAKDKERYDLDNSLPLDGLVLQP